MAESRDSARLASEAVNVTYDELPAVITMEVILMSANWIFYNWWLQSAKPVIWKLKP